MSKEHKISYRYSEKNAVNKQTCEFCTKKFTKISAYRRHLNKVHPILVFNCRYCKLTFQSNKVLSKHVSDYHINNQYSCLI